MYVASIGTFKIAFSSNDFKPKNKSIFKSVYIYILIFIGFIIPIICIMISYGMILIRLRSSIKTNIRYEPGHTVRHEPFRASLHKMINVFSKNCEIQKSASINIIVTILFFLICWTPFQYSLGQEQELRQFQMEQVQQQFISLITVTRKNADWKNGIPIVTLVYVNSALNPFLYSLLTNNFRHEFSKIFL